MSLKHHTFWFILGVLTLVALLSVYLGYRALHQPYAVIYLV